MSGTKFFSIGIRAAMLTIVIMMFLPINSFAQRRWRSPRSRIVVYQPRSYVVYQRRPYYTYRYETYSYPSRYYTTGYDSYSYSYPSPYYTTGYDSYRYSQPYFANRYTYSWANPTYRYDAYRYRPRHRHKQVRVWWR